MHKRLRSVAIVKKFRHLLVMCGLLVYLPVNAQTVLLPGDIQVLTVNKGAAGVDILPLTDIAPGTMLSLGNGSWDAQNQQIINGQAVSVQFEERIAAGTPFRIDSAFVKRSGEGMFPSFDESGILFLYQRENALHRVVYAVIDQGSDESVPASLDTTTILTLPSVEQHHQYHLVNGASGTIQMLNQMISDPDHWRSSETAFSRLQTSFRLLQPPVIQFARPSTSLVEGDTLMLELSIFEHDGSRLLVEAVFSPEQSTADSLRVSGFTRHTFNFTGLIGSADYGIPVPIQDDKLYRGTLTATMVLENLSSGSLGDFVYHPVFIRDDEKPDLELIPTEWLDDRSIPALLSNNERVPVPLDGWSVKLGNQQCLANGGYLEAGEEQFVTTVFSECSKAGNRGNRRELRLFDPEGDLQHAVRLPQSRESATEALSLAGKAEIAGSQKQADVQAALASVSDPEAGDLFKAGWYLVDENAGVDTVFSWVESEGMFREVSAPGPFGATMAFLTEAIPGPDSLEVAVPIDTQQEQRFFVSATDADENGIINDAEGFNLLRNAGNDPITVRTLIQVLEQQTGEKTWYPYAFYYPGEIPDNRLLTTLSSDDLIPPGAAFWIRADSVITPREITFIPVDVPDNRVEVLNENPFSLRLMISNGVDSTNVTLSITDEQEDLRRDLIDPLLSTRLFTLSGSFLRMGFYSDNVVNSHVYVRSDAANRRSYPLVIAGGQDEEMVLSTIGIDDLPDDWTFTLHDSETGQEWPLEAMSRIPLGRPEPVEGQEGLLMVINRFELRVSPPGLDEEPTGRPDIISLGQNYPNPFNPRTTISFYLPDTERVRLSVFNVVGQPVAELVNGTLPAGEHAFDWDATGLPSGMYIYQMETETQVLTKKMTLVK